MNRYCFLFSCLVFFSACHKEESPSHSPKPCADTNVRNIVDPGMKLSRYKEGSWWIYTDSLAPSGLDSIAVMSVLVRRGEPGPVFQCHFVEQHIIEFSWQGVPELQSGDFQVWPDSCFVGDTRGLHAVYLASLKAFRHNLIDSLEVNGKYYKDVRRSDTIRLYSGNDAAMISYFCPEFGFVRLDVFVKGKFAYRKLLLRSRIIR
jgi:hypothetical protein